MLERERYAPTAGGRGRGRGGGGVQESNNNKKRRKKKALARASIGTFAPCSSPETSFFSLFIVPFLQQFGSTIDCSGVWSRLSLTLFVTGIKNKNRKRTKSTRKTKQKRKQQLQVRERSRRVCGQAIIPTCSVLSHFHVLGFSFAFALYVAARALSSVSDKPTYLWRRGGSNFRALPVNVLLF